MIEAMQLDIFQMIMENINLIIFVAGVICFLVVAITQVTKIFRGFVASRQIYRYLYYPSHLPW